MWKMLEGRSNSCFGNLVPSGPEKAAPQSPHLGKEEDSGSHLRLPIHYLKNQSEGQQAIVSGLQWALSEGQRSSMKAIANSSGLEDLAARNGNLN